MSNSVYVQRVGDVSTVTLNRPGCLNALDLDAALRLKDCLQDAAHDGGVTAVVVAGQGRAFCAGGDLAWATRFPGGIRQAFHTLAGAFHQAILEIREMNKPVIAAVNGVAAGGGFSLALACDFRVMHRTATLRQGYTSSGLSMDGGGSFMLPRLVGQARALEIAVFDEPIVADRALQVGLATQVSDDDAADAARRLAVDLAQRSLCSFAWSKRLLNASYHSALEAQLALERQGIVACASQPEGDEGLRAFLAKRRPDFQRARQHDGPDQG